MQLPDGLIVTYLLRWAELMGEIFHPLIRERCEDPLKVPVEPRFTAYR